MTDPNRYASPEELRYGKILEIGATIGLALLALSLVAYVFGLLPSLVPLDQLPRYWGLSAREFVKATHELTGWAWLGRVGTGEAVDLAAIAFLAGLSVLPSLAVLPLFARRRDVVHAVLVVLQIMVLLLAASNVLGAGR